MCTWSSGAGHVYRVPHILHIKPHTTWTLQIHSGQSTHRSLFGKFWTEWWHPGPNRFVQVLLKCAKNQVTLKFFMKLDHLAIRIIDFLQDTAKSAKNNTSDWKADWKNRVSWHSLIKLCCFSHQDCQQKAKHIASIQFSLHPDTKWHSFASSLCYVPFHLAYRPSRQGTVVHWACTRAALPQELGELCCCPPPVSPGSPSAGGDRARRVYTRSRTVFSWQRATALSSENTCSSGVFRVLCKGRADPSLDLHGSPLFQPELSTSKGRKFILSSWQHFWNILLITLWFLRAKSEMKWSLRAYPDCVIKATVRGRNKRRAATRYTEVRAGASKCVGALLILPSDPETNTITFLRSFL